MKSRGRRLSSVTMTLLGTLHCVAVLAWSEEVPLAVTATARVQDLPAGIFFGQGICDGDGNLYFRYYQRPAPFAAPLIKLSPDGKKHTVFRLEGTHKPALNEANVDDFAVDGRGRVYALVRSSDADSAQKTLILRFTGDGQFDMMFGVEPGFFPTRIAAFRTGEVLLSGIEREQRVGAGLGGVPRMAVYSAHGEFVGLVKTSGDVELTANQREREVEMEALAAVSAGTYVSANDGNIYVLR